MSNLDEIIEANTITIPVKDYLRLKQRSKILNALEVAGVDNWDYYDDAMEPFQEQDDDKDEEEDENE